MHLAWALIRKDIRKYALALTEFKTGVLETVPKQLKHLYNPEKGAFRFAPPQTLKGA